MSTQPEQNSHILIDLDGTLATYGEWKGAEHIGEPVAPMVARVKKLLEAGEDVWIFTARIYPSTKFEAVNSFILAKQDPETIEERAEVSGLLIREWCQKHLGRILPITCRKNFGTREIWDDRAIGVMPNKGVDRETFLQWQLMQMAEAAGMKIETGMQYAPVVAVACAKLRAIVAGAEDARAHLDSAGEFLDALKLDTLPEAAQRDIRFARTAIVKALQPMLRAAGK